MAVPIEQGSRHRPELLFRDLNQTFSAVLATVVGDPDRVRVIAGLLDGPRLIDFRRGFRGATGYYKAIPLYVLSHGIGGPSLERALVELCSLGVKTVIRVGTTGALRPDIRPGELIVNDSAVRLDGTSTSYVRAEYPAAASWEVTAALVSATKATGLPFQVGTGGTTSSFFAGQGRETFTGWEAHTPDVLGEMQRIGVLNFEMETATLFTLARLFGLSAGAVCVVVNNRATRVQGGENSVPLACRVALEAAVLLFPNMQHDLAANHTCPPLEDAPNE